MSDSDEGERPDVEFQEKTKIRSQFVIICVFLEVAVLILYGLFVEYPNATESPEGFEGHTEGDPESSMDKYPMFQDVHVMIFIGFGFLMTFLKKYGYSSVGYNFLVSAVAIQWAILVDGFFTRCFEGGEAWHHPIRLDVSSLIIGDFAAAAVLISFGAILGIVHPSQLVAMAMIEIICYSINEKINVEVLEITDVGGSMIIHTFGAYFGLGVSWAFGRHRDTKIDDAAPSYTSNLFSMIGTIFLWMYWPSFNGALAGEAYYAQERAVINTVLSLTASCIAAFTVSKAAHSKFKMEDIQNATLAGGVAVGASADLVIHPWGAILTGLCAGTVSTLGFAYLSDFLFEKINLNDTCGVHNLHGMPGIIGGLGAVLASGVAFTDLYGYFGKGDVKTGRDRFFAHNRGVQAGHQMAALCITLGIAICTGLLTGFLLNTRLFKQETKTFSDNASFVVPKGMSLADMSPEAIFGSKPGGPGRPGSVAGVFPGKPITPKHGKKAIVPEVQMEEAKNDDSSASD